MAVKEKRGRRRYVAFRVGPRTTKEALIGKLRALRGESAPYVVQCSSGWCIVRCPPKDVDDTVRLVTRADPEAESLLTSGTLRTLRDRYPGMRSAPRRRRPTVKQ
ncbi:MAG: hypothetical protein RBQ77_03865 [Candidatus Methanomethylophilaceae archaeon]|jgi:hypothetical protein|nr:hypothetical protein [Candidatus Methanomethylophilaceae archaeon]NLF34111.1 hypothetical protein [Thermoplasmatales archaeon]